MDYKGKTVYDNAAVDLDNICSESIITETLKIGTCNVNEYTFPTIRGDENTIIKSGVDGNCSWGEMSDAYLRDNISKYKWTQLGIDLDGQVQWGNSGNCISMNEDGTIIAIGEPWGGYNSQGTCRILRWDTPTLSWIQMGDYIRGEYGDNSSISVSISADGLTVAIGAMAGTILGVRKGYVKVYIWNIGTSDWVMKGTVIAGKNAFDGLGYSCWLSADGNEFIGGAHNANTSTGCARVYKYDISISNWIQKGVDLTGIASGNIFGASTSMSDDGSIIAVGCPMGWNATTSVGKTYVYKWDTITSAWLLHGSILIGLEIGDQFGYSVSLNSDGTKLCIGCPSNGIVDEKGLVQNYSWNAGTSDWVIMGAPILGETVGDTFGTSVSIDSLGTTIIVGAVYNDGSESKTDCGSARVFKYNSTTSLWNQVGYDLDGEGVGDNAGYFVCISKDSTRISTGAIYANGSEQNCGVTRVFHWTNPVITPITCGGTGLTTLGTAGMFLRTDSTATKMEWFDNTKVVDRILLRVTIQQTIGAADVLLWDTEDLKVGLTHSISTDTDKVYFTRSGTYILTCKVTFSLNNTGVRGAFIAKNGQIAGADYRGGYTNSVVPNSVTPCSFCISSIQYFTAADYVQVYVAQTSGVSLTCSNINSSRYEQCEFAVTMLA